MPRVIEVTVLKTGETKIKTLGYAGNDCLQASRFIEQALGTPAGPDRKTAEFYQQSTVEQQLRQ